MSEIAGAVDADGDVTDTFAGTTVRLTYNAQKEPVTAVPVNAQPDDKDFSVAYVF